MTLAALQILIYHLWIPLFSGSELENFIRQSLIVGVDLFFFMSGASMGRSKSDAYFDFVKNRFCNVYLKFIIFAVVAYFFKGWTLIRLVKTVSMINLFEKGGGAFLWFLPAIMLFYIVFPYIKYLDKKVKSKYSLLVLACVLILWLTIGLSVSYWTNYKDMFIWWNRIPVFVLGYIYGKSQNKQPNVIIGTLTLIIGYIMIYFFANRAKLQTPIADAFYVTLIPATLGWVFLSGQIDFDRFARRYPLLNNVNKAISKSTLEIYAVQMIFGYKIAEGMYKSIGVPIISNVITVILVCVIAVGINNLYSYLQRVGKPNI